MKFLVAICFSALLAVVSSPLSAASFSLTESTNGSLINLSVVDGQTLGPSFGDLSFDYSINFSEDDVLLSNSSLSLIRTNSAVSVVFAGITVHYDDLIFRNPILIPSQNRTNFIVETVSSPRLFVSGTPVPNRITSSFNLQFESGVSFEVGSLNLGRISFQYQSPGLINAMTVADIIDGINESNRGIITLDAEVTSPDGQVSLRTGIRGETTGDRFAITTSDEISVIPVPATVLLLLSSLLALVIPKGLQTGRRTFFLRDLFQFS